jgi:hypothetical protein
MVDINGVSEYPDIVAYTDPNYQAVHVVWMDNRQDAPGVYYLRSTNNGVNWPSTPSLLLDGGRHPAITADSRGLYIVCVKNSDIWYLESTNWGTSWNTPLNVTPSVDYADSLPDIHADAMGRHTIFLRDGSLFYIQRDIIVPSAPTNLHKDPFCVPPPVILLWNANSEPDLQDYRVYRRLLPSGRWSVIGNPVNPTYTDNTVSAGCWYEYYVTARDLALNESSASNVIQIYIPEPKKIVDLGLPEPSIYTLERSGYYHWGGTQGSGTDNIGDIGLIKINPNPSFKKVEITFIIKEQSATHLKIYDATGKLVRSITFGILSAGKHSVALDNNLTEILPGGVYFVELNAGNEKITERFVFWK